MTKKDELVGFQVLSMIYQTKLTNKYLNRKPWKAPNPFEVHSYIPGTIVKINVKVGDKVKAGKSILVQEAMKMLNQIAMPFDGKIKEICVSTGDKVPKNHLMIVIEE